MKKEMDYGKGGRMPNEPWQVNKNLTPQGNDRGIDAFNPRPAYERPCTHTKTNECDH